MTELNRAAAFRVKPRHAKIRLRVEAMGVHENNRSGVYPAGIRCKDLCTEVFKLGFLTEEFTHALVAVEEKPVHEVKPNVPYASAT